HACAELACRGLNLRLVPRADRDLRSLGHERRRDSPAKARRCSQDQRPALSKSEVHQSLLLRKGVRRSATSALARSRSTSAAERTPSASSETMPEAMRPASYATRYGAREKVTSA